MENPRRKIPKDIEKYRRSNKRAYIDLGQYTFVMNPLVDLQHLQVEDEL